MSAARAPVPRRYFRRGVRGARGTPAAGFTARRRGEEGCRGGVGEPRLRNVGQYLHRYVRCNGIRTDLLRKWFVVSKVLDIM